MTTLAAVAEGLAAHGLVVTGAFHPVATDEAPPGAATLCLVGAADGRMWAAYSAAPEATDGAPDPIDRWTRRVVGAVAGQVGARAVYPFGGPPWQPFMRWAGRAEGAVASPIGPAVTPDRGLVASWRAALAFEERLDLSTARRIAPPPCIRCDRPCTTACPVDAFAGGRYDVARCLAHLDSPEGAACRAGGCLARRACPANAAIPAEALARHLSAFRAAAAK